MNGDVVVGDTIRDDSDMYNGMAVRDATIQEIAELTRQLRFFGLSLTDISNNCPKQDRTLESCRKALAYAIENPELMSIMKRTKKLPLATFAEGAGIQRKTLRYALINL